MKLGIVGSEAAKFTKETEKIARLVIFDEITHYQPDEVVSGGCHLGGIDIWAKEEVARMNADQGLHIKFTEHLPKTQNWTNGYKERNLLIADSDVVICITVSVLPKAYEGMKFPICYHCNSDKHVKSGGCWTVKQAKKLGHEGYVLVIS